MPVLLPIHIVGAALGLLSGAIALSVAKGGCLHRASGRVFVYAIFAICATAALAACLLPALRAARIDPVSALK